MPKVLDLTGQRFGKLTVLERLEGRLNGSFVWRCRCDCGAVFTKEARCIKRNHARCPDCPRIDFTGHVISRLTVLREVPAPTGKRGRHFLCACSCGKEVVYSALILTVGSVRSCGCRKAELIAAAAAKRRATQEQRKAAAEAKQALRDERQRLRLERRVARDAARNITGKRVGRLVAVRQLTAGLWLWRCDCGKEREHPSTPSARSCGCLKAEHCRTMDRSNYKRGSAHHRWKGGIENGTELLRKRQHNKYRRWKDAVRARGDWECLVCAQQPPRERLVAHHVNSVDSHPEQIVDPRNGVPLCVECHEDFHNQYGYGNNTRAQFEAYLTARWVA